jgi:MFS family permease
MWEQIRAMPRTAWILFAGTVINRFGTFVMPMLAIYLTRQGYSPARAGLAISAYGAGHLCASLLGGHLADRIGRRNTIVISMFASALTMLALAQARHYAAIVALTYLAGLCAELYRPASHALIADVVTPEQRVTAFSLYRFAINLGFAAGPATAGFLADRSFFYVFLGDSITSIVFGVIALVALTNVRRPDFSPATGLKPGLRPIFLAFLAATVCVTLVDFQMGATFALHVKSLGFTTSAYGMLVSLNGALIICFELAITNIVRKRRPQSVIAAGYFLSGIGLAQTAFAHTMPALALTVTIWTIGEMVSSPMAGAYVAMLAPPQQRGRYMGFLSLSQSFGMCIGPLIGTLVYQHDPMLVWAGCALLGCAAAALALWRVGGSETAI